MNKEQENDDDLAIRRKHLRQRRFYGKVIEHWDNGEIKIIEITEIIKPRIKKT